MVGDFRTEHVAKKPHGWNVRTMRTETGHELRVAFPVGPRKKGSGRLLEILHPSHENPRCEVTPAHAANSAASFFGIENPSELLMIGVNGSQENPGELLILGAGNPSKKETRERAARIRSARLNPKDHLYEKGAMRYGIPGQSYRFRTLSEAKDAIKPEFHHQIKKIRNSVTANPAGETQQDKAADLYREFHGKEPSEMVQIQRSDLMRQDYTGLGDLDSLVVVHNFSLQEFLQFRKDMKRENGDLGRVHKPADTGMIFFDHGDDVKLASNPDGTQLYCLGGNQDLTPCLLDLGVDPTKDLIDLGYCISVRYITEKAHNRFEPGLYWHILGEETHQPPRIMYDKIKREIFFIGGAYVVRAPGIIN